MSIAIACMAILYSIITLAILLLSYKSIQSCSIVLIRHSVPHVCLISSVYPLNGTEILSFTLSLGSCFHIEGISIAQPCIPELLPDIMQDSAGHLGNKDRAGTDFRVAVADKAQNI